MRHCGAYLLQGAGPRDVCRDALAAQAQVRDHAVALGATGGAHRFLPDQDAYARDLAMVRGAVEEADSATGWVKGAAMPPESKPSPTRSSNSSQLDVR